MIHVHKKECDSTQDLAASLTADSNESLLVSCEKQVKGAGQRGRKWISADQSLALSFNARPAEIYTLTSLEMAVLAKKFIWERFKKEVLFKWPNDLYTKERKKCGGILIQGQTDRLIIGIGLNLFLRTKTAPEELKDKIAGILDHKTDIDIKESSFQFYSFVADNRLPANLIKCLWLQSCVHLNRKVKILEGGKSIEGVFMGLGNNGQCLLKTSKGLSEFYSASLIIDP
ncbi:MAG: biotin--[acetyl-CoA-carboxylase] ligase [Bacteriovoracaceae bacterium]